MIMLGCVTTGNVCEEDMYKTGLICSISERTNIAPESISNILVITNTVALAESAYTVDEAEKFVTDAIANLDNLKTQITYGQVVGYLINKFDLLSPKAKLVFIVIDPLNQFMNQDDYFEVPLLEGDIKLLKIHLQKQLERIIMFKALG